MADLTIDELAPGGAAQPRSLRSRIAPRVLLPRTWPWWVQVVAIYALARLITTVALLLIATTLTVESRAGVDPDFFTYTTLWDGQWYWYIASVGYPSELPVDAAGIVQQNQWAFMPVYPFSVSVVSLLTGLWWPAAAFFTALGFGFGAALVLYRIARRRLEHGRALFAVVLFSVGPLSFIFQMAYAESMQAFLLALALLLLLERRWNWLFPVVAVMALTRPTGLAFALTLAVYWVFRYRSRDRDPFPPRERWIAGCAAVFSGVAGLAWLVIAWIATGSFSAYTDTEIAWRTLILGHQHLELFTPWFQAGNFWFGQPWGVIAITALLVGFVVLFFVPAVRRMSIELRIWVASYGTYLFAVFFPQTSTFRLLLPMFPLVEALAQPKSTAYRVTVVCVSLALQILWMYVTWGPVEAYWTVP